VRCYDTEIGQSGIFGWKTNLRLSYYPTIRLHNEPMVSVS